MKILIFGGNGQLASELKNLSHVCNKNEYFFADRESIDFSLSSNFFDIINDLTPDIVINAVGYTGVDAAESNSFLATKVNSIAVMDLALACARFKVRLIHISTDYVFDGLKKQEYTESDKCNPLNIYGHSKYLGEEMVRHFTNDYIILRVSWVFGAYGKNFLKTIIQKSKSVSELSIVCDQFGGPTPTALIVNCLDQICTLTLDNNIKTGTYNISGQPYVSWYEFTKNIISTAQQHKLIKEDIKIIPIKSINYESSVKRPNDSRLSINKIKQVLPSMNFNYSTYLGDIMAILSKDKFFYREN